MDLTPFDDTAPHQHDLDATNLHSAHSTTRILLMLSSSLDCDALSLLFKSHHDIDVVGATCQLETVLELSRRCGADIIVIDSTGEFDAVAIAAETLQRKYAKHVVVLDERVRDGLLDRLLDYNHVSYLLRRSGFQNLVDAILRISESGFRVFDPTIAQRIVRTPSGFRLKQGEGESSVACLTKREREIMRLLASGQSVRHCAHELQLAESTIDNHKSRLMKKLHIHKMAEMTQLAIRDGLISI